MSISLGDRIGPAPPLNAPLPVKRFSPPRTALAFMLSPGIATLIFAVAYAVAISGGTNVDSFPDEGCGIFDIAPLAGVVAYLCTGVLAVPLYLHLPDDMRGDPFRVVLSAGGVAMLSVFLFLLFPSILIAVLFAGAVLIPAALALAFGFGCVAGIAFLLIRGAPLPPPR